MASSCLSNDKRNFQCVVVASVDLIKLPLRDILANHIKPTDLFQKIKSCSTLNLRKEQQMICFIQPPGVPDYSAFDVSLLYTLIRNLCSLPCPAQGWGNEPKATDTQTSDDIERLRLFRNNYYAHAESAVITDSMFKDIWRNLRSAIIRIQSSCNVDYEDELIRIEQSKYTASHWEECMTILNAYASKQKQTDGRGERCDPWASCFKDEPDIFIQGENEIICGGTARFEADVKNVESSCWSITWQKRRGDVIKCIDTNMERYNGSTKNTFVINSVSKEDEGEYQAVLSLESNGPDYKSRNTIRLHAIGEIPYVDILRVKSGSEGITIHYKCGALEQSPKVHQIEWSKNGQQLDNNSKKYAGGSVHDNCFTITSPTNDDKGNYSCKVINAVGSVSATISLDIPSVVIFIDSPVCFGSETTIKSVISTSIPTPEKIEWQKSKDGVNFYCIRSANYSQSTDNSTCPSFVISKISFANKLYYRLLVWNGIGKGVSNTVYLNVTGSPPNFTTSVDTNIKNRSVKLIGKLYFFDDSPGILETFWTKDGEKIDTKESGGKLLDISNDYSSLIITNVSPDDAGDYQLTAINAVGSSTSDVMVLGVPSVFVKRVEGEKNGGRRITVTIKSLPAPCHIQWSAKTKDDDSFTPIDINAEDYKGTMVSFPHPVLVVTKKDQLEKKCYQIEVTNFIGKTVQDISGNIKSTVGKKDIVENTFYKDRGARVRFTKLSNILAKEFPSEKLENLKFTLTNSNIVQNRTSVIEAKSALECIRILQDEDLFTQTDVIAMQFLCTQTDCSELYDKCVEYAQQQKALCYFEKPPVNGYKDAQFHVQGDISNYTKQYIQDVIVTVTAILDCKEEDILLNGVRYSKSFLLSLSVKEVLIRKFQAMNEQDRLKLIRLDIDYLIIDKETIPLAEIPKELEVYNLEKSTAGHSKLRTISSFRRKVPFLQNRKLSRPPGTKHMDGFEYGEENEIRIVLIGNTRSGKSATGNTILGKEAFISRASRSSITRNCNHKSAIRFGKKICIVDTPGFFNTEETDEKVQQEIAKSITLTSPGPHAFILVLNITRFSQGEYQAVKDFVHIFGSDICKYFIILFTEKDILDYEGKTIFEYIKSAPPHLQSFIQDCGGRVVAFDNELELGGGDEQVEELLSIIKNNVEKNENKFYRNKNKMYEKVEQIIQEKEAMIRQIVQMERNIELKTREDKEADEIVKEIKEEIIKAKEEMQKLKETLLKRQERMKAMTELLEQNKNKLGTVVREEKVVEEKGILGYIWECIKLILPGSFR